MMTRQEVLAKFEASPKCKYCEEAGIPEHFGSPRTCAFPDQGTFNPDNWNCALINTLCDLGGETVWGDDESLQVIPANDDDYGGWIIVTRYKRRGCASSAVHVGDFWPAKPLTYKTAVNAVKRLQTRQQFT